MMPEIAHPRPKVGGGFARRSLAVNDAPRLPFASKLYDMGLICFEDANLGTLRPEQDDDPAPVADGSTSRNAVAAAKSVTGVVVMVGGAVVLATSQRQHHVHPDVHTTELHAAGTAVQVVMPLAGILQEFNIPQLRPIPVFCDSQSTIFVANNQSAVKRSVWTSRRAAALRAVVDSKDVQFLKIASADNVADMLTRPVTHAELVHLLRFVFPQGQNWEM